MQATVDNQITVYGSTVRRSTVGRQAAAYHESEPVCSLDALLGDASPRLRRSFQKHVRFHRNMIEDSRSRSSSKATSCLSTLLHRLEDSEARLRFGILSTRSGSLQR
jgi:hypothetical protein